MKDTLARVGIRLGAAAWLASWALALQGAYGQTGPTGARGGGLAEAAPRAALADTRGAPLTDAERTKLRALLDAAVAKKAVRGAKAGLVVVDLRSGETLYERNADMLLNPASVTKVVTAATALRRLGPEFRFVTTVFAAQAPTGPALAGELFVKGSGDPKLTTENMYKLASSIAALGVRTVGGGIVVDESYFDTERLGAGWEQDASDRPYQAPAGAASVNFNALEVRVYPGDAPGKPARVFTDPATAFVRIDNTAVTTRKANRTKLKVKSVPERGRTVMKVEGRIAVGHAGYSTWRKIDNPPLYFGTLLREVLGQVGVKVQGEVRVGKVPDDAVPLTKVVSPSLALLVTDMNKVSQNFMAEQLLKTVGAQTAGAPGSWKSGIAAVQHFLSEIGIAANSYTFQNGSGLNDVNRFTARQVVTLLAHMWGHFPTAAEFVSSLAVAGADGSVKRRLRGAAMLRRVRVKTGWLRGVSCLAGYAGGPRPVAFALFLNGVPGSAVGHRAQQRVSRILALFPGGQ